MPFCLRTLKVPDVSRLFSTFCTFSPLWYYFCNCAFFKKFKPISNMRFIVPFLAFFLTFSATAQQPPSASGSRPNATTSGTLKAGPAIGAIDGRVFDSLTRQPMEYVAIAVCRETDSSVVSGIFTGENGEFALYDLPAGNYYARITFSGYTEKFIGGIHLSMEKPLRRLGNISLAPEGAEVLEETVVVAERQMLQTGIDKKVYNVGEDISVTGGSANDALNNVPSVEIDQDGRVSLRGDANVTILIDGRPSSLSGGNGRSLLDGISAASIERIEVVTNPSAKYDPDGTSGIINIVLKKNIRRGLNGQVSLSGATGNAYNGSVSMNMRNTRFNVFGNYAYDYREGYRNNNSDLTQRYADSTVYFRQRRLGTDLSEAHTLKVGMDIYLKDRNTLSWNVAGNTGHRDRTGEQTNFRYLGESDTLGFWNRSAYDPTQNKNLDFGLNYNWEFKEEKGSIDWNAYQSLGNGANQGYYHQWYAVPADTAGTTQRLFSEEQNNITTLSMDVVRIIKGKWRTESGLKLIHRNMGVDTHSDARDASGVFSPDTLAFFTYEYTERIYSAYGILAGTYKKFKYQGGLRFEQSYQEPNLVSSNQSFRNDYSNVFPSAHVRYAPFKKGEFSVGYSKRINRASAENLNPFTSYADPYNLRRGNPALKPEFIHSLDFGYELVNKKWSLTVAAYQRFSNQVIQRVKEFYENGTSAGTFANVDNSRSTGGELVLQVRPYPVWRNTISANGNYVVYADDNTTTNFNREGFVFSMKYASAVELMKRTLTLQVNGRYSAPSVTAQGRVQPRGSVEFSADKSFKDGKWGAGMRVSDVFNTQGFLFDVSQGNISQHSEMKWQTRRLYLSVRYKFGRTDTNERKKPAADPSGGNGGGFDF